MKCACVMTIMQICVNFLRRRREREEEIDGSVINHS